MKYDFEKTKVDDIYDIILLHTNSLSYPIDSFTEDKLLESNFTKIVSENKIIGYIAENWDSIFSFYIIPEHYKNAISILENFISTNNIYYIHVMTQDSLLNSILMEWDYSITKRTDCCFTDILRLEKPKSQFNDLIFRPALIDDVNSIILKTEDFFENLDSEIPPESLYILESDKEILGYGILEKGKIFTNCVSIGMITCKEHRKKGVSQIILWYLKELSYSLNLKPIAGCWYYNTLSRKSLESAGMIISGKGYIVKIESKENPPIRTGNPPGELI